MAKTVSRKSDIPDNVGLQISDVVQHLQRKGYDITAQQIRQYEERDGLIKSIRTKSNYREYTSYLVDCVAFIRCLEMGGISKKWIKNLFVLRRQIEKHPAVSAVQLFEEGSPYVLRRSVEAEKGSTDYLKLQTLVDRYADMWDTITGRLESVKRIMEAGIQDAKSQKEQVKKLKE